MAVKPHAGPGVSRHQLSVRPADVEKMAGLRAVRRRAALSVPRQGRAGGGFLHRLRRPRRGDDHVLRADGGLCAAAWARPHDLPPGRHIAIAGDAELDEGNIYEALLEGWKHDVRNRLVDRRLQPPEPRLASCPTGCSAASRACSATWAGTCVTIKYGRKLEAAFAREGGEALRRWIDDCPNSLYSALTFQGGAAWRQALLADLGRSQGCARSSIRCPTTSSAR